MKKSIPGWESSEVTTLPRRNLVHHKILLASRTKVISKSVPINLQPSFVVEQSGLRVYPGEAKSQFEKLRNGSYRILVEQLYPNITYTLKVLDLLKILTVCNKVIRSQSTLHLAG